MDFQIQVKRTLEFERNDPILQIDKVAENLSMNNLSMCQKSLPSCPLSPCFLALQLCLPSII